MDEQNNLTIRGIIALLRISLGIISIVLAFEAPMTSLALSAVLFVSYYADKEWRK